MTNDQNTTAPADRTAAGGRVQALVGLRELATEACNAAFDRSHEFRNNSINWADLRCVQAQYCVDDDGDETHMVWIEEASPDSVALAIFVEEYLAARGHPNVECHCEW
jgi:hypothetical protein